MLSMDLEQLKSKLLVVLKCMIDVEFYVKPTFFSNGHFVTTLYIVRN